MFHFSSDGFLFDSRCLHSDHVLIQLTQYNRSFEQINLSIAFILMESRYRAEVTARDCLDPFDFAQGKLPLDVTKAAKANSYAPTCARTVRSSWKSIGL